MPLSLVESTAFRELMSKAQPSFQMPSRKHLSQKLIPERASSVQDRLKKALLEAKSVCLTIDLWSSRDMRSFIGITGHYIENFILHTIMLACNRFKGRHTADNIQATFEETVSEYGIGQKVLTVVTDNAANMVKAFSLPGYEELSDEDEENHGNGEDTSAQEDIDCPETTEEDMECIMIEHVPCFAHTLQLVVRDGLKQAKPLHSVIAKASRLVAHVRKSTHATELFADFNRLQMANDTRWNSQLKMLRSIIQVPSEVMDKLNFHGKLGAYEIRLITEICEILLPFEEATDEVQGDNIVTSSKVIICVRGLRQELATLSETYNCKLVKALQDSLETRLGRYENMPSFRLAAVLDPRYKLDWCANSEEQE